MLVNTERLNAVLEFHLSSGSHASIEQGACIMELVSWVAGEAWSDTPECACPVLCAFMQSWNDSLPDAERDALLRPLIPRLVGTRATPEIEERRAMMAADWLIREHTPAWLRLAGLTAQADALASLPEITDFLRCPSLMPTLNAVRTAAAAARDAPGTAPGTAARAAAWAAARAARAAAGGAAGDAAGTAARGAAGDAAWAARGAAGTAARAALNATRLELQQSALRLVGRMIEARAP